MQDSAEMVAMQPIEKTEAEITDNVVDALAQIRLQLKGRKKKVINVEIAVFR